MIFINSNNFSTIKYIQFKLGILLYTLKDNKSQLELHLELPKLIYVLSVLPLPNMKTINDLEKCMFNFIWDGKPDKIKRDTLKQIYQNGGIKMTDIKNS